ncbi:MAG: acetyl-CoA carboxylase biotin carboxylase subunit [Pseudomonadota bacterium]
MSDTPSTSISSILIANRGEIACRIIRTVKDLGLRAVAVYSEADAEAPHVRMADDAVLIGSAPVAESYLRADKILAAAKSASADAIHPGYGFLSENAAFAAACAEAGLIFIGPTPDAIDLMGDKAKAKRRMIDAGVPCIPGYQGVEQDDATLINEAAAIGFPLMVKAAAGGGGRGMRLVHEESALAGALTMARSEAENAFGSGDLILERVVMAPRHVEVQVFADHYGAVIHLGERDCSVQRRHQKVLEEAPCPVMTPALREAMGDAAVKAARDIGYRGAGTVEFLLDEDGAFYFLEMNTRLQVEHPVTELVTGLDLVAMQIRVAQGEPLPLTQDDISLKGHAIEARLYAEDVSQNFLPATGPVLHWSPATSDGVRIDAGVESGGAVSPFYDPMIAKVIAYGHSRDEARRKLINALRETTLFGVTTNKKFLIDALEKPAFAKGEATTGFITEEFDDASFAAPTLTLQIAAIGAAILHAQATLAAQRSAISVTPVLIGWASATRPATPYRFAGPENDLTVSITDYGAHCYETAINEETVCVEILSMGDDRAALSINGARQAVNFFNPLPAKPAEQLFLAVDGADFHLTNLNSIAVSESEQAGAGAVTAPMHGALIDVFVEPGQKVSRGDQLAVLEAMKMQHELTAAIDGQVGEIHVKAGDQVAANTLLMSIDAATASD